MDAWLFGIMLVSFLVMLVIAAPLEMRRRMEVRQGVLPKSTPRVSFLSPIGGPHFDLGYIWSKDFTRSPYVTPIKVWLLRLSTTAFFLCFAVLFAVPVLKFLGL